MAMPNTQPVLPAEVPFTDAELLFISEQPKRLFPENQNSNFGLLRRILTEKPQDAVNLLSELVTQGYVDTASDYLGRWERQMGLPVAPTGHSDANRREMVSQRRTIDLFSKPRLKKTVETFLVTTSGGAPTLLTPSGVPIDGSGITLFSDGGSVTAQYRIYYEPRTFSYQVWIVSSTTPDLVTLTRMLNFITPAGMSFTIDNTKAAIINYGKTVLSKQPVAFFRLVDYTDASGYANHGTAFGTINELASPGLLVAGKDDDQSGITFNGTTGYITAPDQNYLDLTERATFEFWIKPVSITGTQMILDKGNGSYNIRMSNGTLEFRLGSTGSLVNSTIALVNGQTYHVVMRRSGDVANIVIDTVDRSGAVVERDPWAATGTALHIGRHWSSGNFLNASLDELAIYNRYLSDAEILENYNAGKLINP